MYKVVVVLFVLATACYTSRDKSGRESIGRGDADAAGGSGGIDTSKRGDRDAGSADVGTPFETCDFEEGTYQAAYQKVDGSCEFPRYYTIPIPFRHSTTEGQRLEKNESNDAYSTNITFQDCVLEIEYRVAAINILFFVLDGTFEIEDATHLVGGASITQYNTDQTIECEGKYDVVLTKIAELPVYNQSE